MFQAMHQTWKRLQNIDQPSDDMRLYLQSHLEYCSVKYANAYSFAFDVVVNNGIYRLSEK